MGGEEVEVGGEGDVDMDVDVEMQVAGDGVDGGSLGGQEKKDDDGLVQQQLGSSMDRYCGDSNIQNGNNNNGSNIIVGGENSKSGFNIYCSGNGSRMMNSSDCVNTGGSNVATNIINIGSKCNHEVDATASDTP